jgi:hypothetical protein
LVPHPPQRRRTWRANSCEFGGADSSTFALLAEPDPMVPVPFLVEANVAEPVVYRYPTGLKGIGASTNDTCDNCQAAGKHDGGARG